MQNFGALMLHGKITRSWPELPSDQYDQLRLELFRALARFSTGPKLVLTQLCRALVGVAFNTMPERWPNTVVTSIQTLRRATQDVPVLLLLLLYRKWVWFLRRQKGVRSLTPLTLCLWQTKNSANLIVKARFLGGFTLQLPKYVLHVHVGLA